MNIFFEKILERRLPEDVKLRAQIESEGGQLLAIAKVMDTRTPGANGAWEWTPLLNSMEEFRWLTPGNDDGTMGHFSGHRETVTYTIAQVPEGQVERLKAQGWIALNAEGEGPAAFARNYVKARLNGRGNRRVLVGLLQE